MAFVIVEPALVAALLAAAAPAPDARPPAVPACGGGQASTAGFDCCLHLARWNAPASTTPNTPALSSSDAAADQKEGR